MAAGARASLRGGSFCRVRTGFFSFRLSSRPEIGYLDPNLTDAHDIKHVAMRTGSNPQLVWEACITGLTTPIVGMANSGRRDIEFPWDFDWPNPEDEGPWVLPEHTVELDQKQKEIPSTFSEPALGHDDPFELTAEHLLSLIDTGDEDDDSPKKKGAKRI